MSIFVDWMTGALGGAEVGRKEKRAGGMRGVYRDDAALGEMEPDRLIYSVQFWTPVAEGTTGGLFWGTTTIEPGVVGDEYFMTQGHFHAVRDRAEYYATLSGEGGLILMDESRRAWVEPMRQGSLHYIPGRVAHRVANTGEVPLTFMACWPSDSGHDYESILRFGFSARLRRMAGSPALVPEQP